MGAEPWSYFVAYDSDIQRALDRLRATEFAAGRFRYAEETPATIEEALAIADADGTASILDIDHVAEEPDFCAVAPFSENELIGYFGTARPSRHLIAENQDFFEDLDRGQGRYIIAYDQERPTEIFFAGYSFD